MNKQTFYILAEEELMQIGDLCESLGLAVDKIIRGRRLIREYSPEHYAVQGYRQMIHDTMIAEDKDYDPTTIF